MVGYLHWFQESERDVLNGFDALAYVAGIDVVYDQLSHIRPIVASGKKLNDLFSA